MESVPKAVAVTELSEVSPKLRLSLVPAQPHKVCPEFWEVSPKL